MAKTAETPLIKQYNQFKAQHPDALLLMRVGDFYEAYGDDALRASQILGIVLTKKSNGASPAIDMAGFHIPAQTGARWLARGYMRTIGRP